LTSYDTSLIVPNPNAYLFWDGVHPTATVHAILAERARMLLVGLPGDHNAAESVTFVRPKVARLAIAWREGPKIRKTRPP